MKVIRRLCLFLCALAVLALGGLASRALALDYPNRPIRIVAANPPGSTTDLLARLIAQKLAERWRQPVTVENRAGGGTVIATDIVAKAPPDGYTILMVGVALVVNPSLRRDLPYDTEKMLVPVSRLAFSPIVLVVHPSLAVHSVRELIDLAKSRPGKINFASAGNGSGSQVAGELLKRMTGVSMVHIPYKGEAPAVTALLGGQVQAMFGQLPGVLPHILNGKLRAVAIASGVRSHVMPQLPTVAEAGVPGFKVDVWFGALAPGGTPDEIVSRLNSEISSIMRMPDITQRLMRQGVEPATNTPKEFAEYIHAEIADWADLIRKSGARVD